MNIFIILKTFKPEIKKCYLLGVVDEQIYCLINEDMFQPMIESIEFLKIIRKYLLKLYIYFLKIS